MRCLEHQASSPKRVFKSSLFNEEMSADEALVCSHCQTRITDRTQAIEREGLHEHWEVNPNGVDFHIACFAQARCVVTGLPTDEWSWFSGYQWQMAHCPGCGSHLGWYYRAADGDDFYGLIMQRLQSGSAPESRV